MSHSLKLALMATAVVVIAAPVQAQVTFFEGENFRGRAFSSDRTIRDFVEYGFTERAASVVVESGRWLVCDDARFAGRCSILSPGRYDTLSRMQLNDRIASMRPLANDERYSSEMTSAGTAPPAPDYAYRRRPGERLFDVQVSAVRPVFGPPEKRCWVDRERVGDAGRGRQIGGAVAGAVVGGILGHQIGSGRGQDIATAGGAVAGAAVGSSLARGGGSSERDVERCETVAATAPEYWDVTYYFRGVEHRVQMTSPPGQTITVNSEGEPRD